MIRTVVSGTNVPKLNDIGNDGRGAIGTPRGAPRPITLSNGTLRDTFSKSAPTEIVQSMTKSYPTMIKFYEFKNPFKKDNPDYEKPPKLTNTVNKSLSEEQKEENKQRSLRRTRQMITDKVACNDFDQFGTLTFDPKKHPRCNEREYATKIAREWLKNQQRLHGRFNYILSIEKQKSGNYHFHLLLGGFTGKYHQTKTIRIKGKELKRYKIDSWEKKNGFADLSDIGDKGAIGAYVAKYITKDFDETEENQKRYWASKGLKEPVKKYHETLASVGISDLDIAKASIYENEHCEIITIPRKAPNLSP